MKWQVQYAPTVLSFNMQEVAKDYSYTRHSSIPAFLMMNKRLFGGLPKNLQAMVEQTALEAMEKHNKLWGEMTDKTVSGLKSKGMIFNEVKDISEFQKAVGCVWKDFEPIVRKDLTDAIVSAK